ncbi:hypothetical protein C8F04DRAFT_971550, partial [Mycena alexandri]
EEWAKVDQDFTRRLYDSLPTRGWELLKKMEGTLGINILYPSPILFCPSTDFLTQVLQAGQNQIYNWITCHQCCPCTAPCS